ncbi:hypothetical protein AAFN60_18360 [Roseibacillus persicicus]|uniref:Membrane protein n=1 Tax=Roseibacillus persicicus TaxID=454148 RepID=A0A918TVM5_9BACT|nr:hypothetical protein [Roseibacillus persicicus]GHC65480.1 membrane protein [Roseibacillus persicicus]
MQQPPPYQINPAQQADKDAEHLNLLSIFHYVNAGLMGLYLLFLIGHFLVVNTMFNSPEFSSGSSSPPPAELMGWIRGFYVLIGLIVIGLVVMNILAARFLKTSRNRIFLFILAGINCLNMPIGTVLGVFTFIVLLRPSVAARFGSNAA